MAFLNSRSRRAVLGCATLAAASLMTLSGPARAADGWDDVKKAGVLRCGAAVAAPYVMRDARSGQYSGFFVDLCRDFGEKELKVKVEFVDTNWDNLVAGVQSGSWDLALALNETPERKKAVSFSSAAVDYQISFVVLKEGGKFGARPGNTLADFDKPGVRFVVMSGTAQDKLLSASLKQGTIQRLPGVDETRLALISKRADVLVDANDTNRLFTVTNPRMQEVLLQPTLGKQPVAFGMNLNRSEADVKTLSDYVNRRRANGEIDALVDKAARIAVEAAKKP